MKAAALTPVESAQQRRDCRDLLPKQIPSLDGLRAISITLVLIGHAVSGKHSFLFRALLIHHGEGVGVFFVISGFLITHLLMAERNRNGTVSLRSFYVRRALRILPAFLLYVGTVALLSVVGLVFIHRLFWLNVFTYTVNFVASPPQVLAHLWSLSVEEQFYFLWPLVFALAHPKVSALVAIIAVFSALFTHTALHIVGAHLVGYAFPLVCGPIASGCLLALWEPQIKHRIISSRVLSSGWTLLISVLFVAFTTTLFPHSGVFTIILDIVNYSLIAFCVARMIFLPKGATGRFLNAPGLVWIGKRSYSIYLWQQLLLLGGLPSSLGTLPWNLVAAIGAASISYRCVEMRFLGLRTKFRQQIAD